MPVRLLLPVVAAVACAIGAGSAVAKTSHEGWPRITGHLKMNKDDSSRPLTGGRRNDELLGGHGNDTIRGNGGQDVIWGDYKPSGQPLTQHDRIYGGTGNDFIYASHGFNLIHTGGGRDIVHARYGSGDIYCDSKTTIVNLSKRSQRRYHLHGCPIVTLRAVGTEPA